MGAVAPKERKQILDFDQWETFLVYHSAYTTVQPTRTVVQPKRVIFEITALFATASKIEFQCLIQQARTRLSLFTLRTKRKPASEYFWRNSELVSLAADNR